MVHKRHTTASTIRYMEAGVMTFVVHFRLSHYGTAILLSKCTVPTTPLNSGHYLFESHYRVVWVINTQSRMQTSNIFKKSSLGYASLSSKSHSFVGPIGIVSSRILFTALYERLFSLVCPSQLFVQIFSVPTWRRFQCHWFANDTVG